MTAIGVTVLFVDCLLREQIGFGTVIDALLTGNFVQMFNVLNPLPANRSLGIGVAAMTAGFVFMALGMAVYMKAGQGCGPRDALLVGIGKRLPGLPIGAVQIGLWGAVLLGGWLLGGPVGFGTLLSTVGAGAVLQAVYQWLRFEPRDVKHKGFAAVVRLWREA